MITLIKRYKSLPAALLAGLILAGAAWAVQGLPVLRDLERKAEDLRFQLFPSPARVDTNVVLVAIDDGSLAYMNQLGVDWPWPRGVYEGMLSFFAAGGEPAAVLFDLQFTGEDFYMEDDLLAAAMRRSGRVAQGVQLVPDSTRIPPLLDQRSMHGAFSAQAVEDAFAGMLAPIDPYLENAGVLGVINVQPDDDGVIRRIPLVYSVQGRMLSQMALAGLRAGQGAVADELTATGLRADSLFIPVGEDGRYRVNWYGPGGLDGPFAYYPMRDIIVSMNQLYSGREPALSPGLFDGKYIVVGAIAGGLLDLKTTPTDRIFPGMEIWATALSNMLQRDYVRESPAWVTLLLLYVTCFLVYLGSVNLPLKWALPGAAAFVLLIVGAATLAWMWQRCLSPVMSLVTGLLVSWLVSVTINYMMEGRAKNQIRRVFTRYNHPDVVERLMADPDAVEMGGEEIEATVLFTDIADFTTFAETKQPKEIVNLLNQYFTEFAEILFAHDGMLDKFTGDGVMALFGAPIATSEHALQACRAALAHKRLRPTGQSAFFHSHTRIGVNSGVFIVGNIGSQKRMDYTAIGDAVNLAARLEGVGKLYGVSLVVSEATWAMVNERIVCRELDTIRVKGKDTPTRIFELIGESGVDDIPAWVDEYHAGLALYRAGDFVGAGEVFARLADSPASDSAAKEMLDRCRNWAQHPPEQWDGILTLERK